MNRKVFMERLRECLADISAEEREDALTYYESYFEEAGVENEAQVIEELGSPEKVAENIKRDLFEEPQSSIQAPECMKKESSEDFSSEDLKKTNNTKNMNKRISQGRIAMIICNCCFNVSNLDYCGSNIIWTDRGSFWCVVRMCSGRHCRNSGTSDIGSGINWNGNRRMHLRQYCSRNPCDRSRIFRNGNRNPFIDLCCMDLWQGSSGMLPLDRQSL